ncbi:MAG: gliding motility-associated C-terminal domain-containing protein [Bacteroidia bacterium]|nr:gliding motility-associated C-terminal domain-containing protein [Bacteroidia bacterium]
MRKFFTVLKPVLIAIISIAFAGFMSLEKANASHVMGADITYACQPDGSYKVILKVYRNCGGAALASKLPLAYSSQSCGVTSRIDSATRVSILDVSPLCAAQQQLSNCIDPANPFPGVEEHVYELFIDFPVTCTDWIVGWSLCCRDPSVTNSIIPNFSSTRIYIEAMINNTLALCDTAPQFVNIPVTYICDNQPVEFSSGAVEPQGDSLVFELTDPLDGNYVSAPIPVPYQPGFNINYPVSTNPPNNFQFDQATGQFDFTPSGLQKGIVALRVNEYRNGQLIGYTMRDMQWVVIPCANQNPVIDPPTNISGGQFNNNVFSVCAGDELQFDLRASDDLIDSLFLTTTDLPGATVTQISGGANNNPLTGRFSWPTTTADIGTYFISFNFRDNGCPTIGQASVGFTIIVNEGTVLPTQNIFYCPSTTDTIFLQATSTGDYQWSVPTGVTLSNDTIRDPYVLIPPSGIVDLSVTVRDSPNCNVIESFHIEPEATVSVAPDTVEICLGDSAQLDASFTVNGVPQSNIDLQWNPSIGLNNTVIANPMASPPSTQLYTLTITSPSLNCSYEANVFVIVNEPPVIDPISDTLVCAGDSVQLLLTGQNLTNSTVLWSPTLGLSDPNVLNPIAFPTVTQTYTATVTNSCGSDFESVTVNVNQPLNVILSGDDVLCNGDSSGSITATTLGGGNNPVYTWTPSPPLAVNSPTQINVPAGTYTVTVVDDAQCRDTADIVINEPSPLSIQIIDLVNNLCVGGNSGQIEVAGTGGTGPYEYRLVSPGSQTPWRNSGLFINLIADSYEVQMRDANGCTFNLPLPITEPSSGVQASIVSQIDATCGIRGELVVNGVGGTPFANGYQFFLNNVFQSNGFTQTFSNLNPGYYEVTIVDSNGCRSTVGDTVREIDPPIVTIDSIADASCFGQCNGFVRFRVNLGSPPYTLALDANVTSDTVFNNLCPGFHFFQVEDGNACKFGLIFFIDQPDSLYGEVINQSFPTCENSTDGSLTVQAVGGTQPYTYSLLGQPGTTDSLFTNLDSGFYTFVVEDLNQCQDTFTGSLVDPSPLRIDFIASDIACAGEQNGTIELSATGGTPDYEYSFSGSIFVDDSIFFGLAAGNYPVKVEDAQGCQDSAIVTIIEPDPLTLSIAQVQNALCNGSADGTITVVPGGGTGPFEYSIDQINYGSSPTFNGLRTGNYTLYVRDSQGCEAEVSTTVGEPDPLFGTVDWRDITCQGANDGGGSVFMSGGTQPYRYIWSNGETSSTVNNLPPGNPTVTVTDAQGCQVAFSGDLIDPPLFFIDSTSTLDATCFGICDGFLWSAAAGGTPPYNYIWSNNATDSFQNNVCADEYILTAIDDNGCEVLDTLIVNEPPEIIIEVVDKQDASCGQANGTITVAASGGAGDFTYFWSNNQEGPTASDLLGGILPPVIYQVFVTDSTNCSNSLSIDLGVGASPIADFETEFSPLDSLLFPEDGVQFINLSQNATDYFWDFGDGSVSNEENPLHIFPGPGLYSIMLIAYDPGFQCPDTIIKDIQFYPPGRIFVPTGFTPNGDNINDNFFAVGAGVITMKLDIFDRWGRHLKTLNSLEEVWDGTNAQGNPVQEGVYVWKLEALLNDQVPVSRVGTVTLLR